MENTLTGYIPAYTLTLTDNGYCITAAEGKMINALFVNGVEYEIEATQKVYIAWTNGAATIVNAEEEKDETV